MASSNVTVCVKKAAVQKLKLKLGRNVWIIGGDIHYYSHSHHLLSLALETRKTRRGRIERRDKISQQQNHQVEPIYGD